MTISQLKEDSKFLRLTDKQKTWVIAFVESNGDKLKAARAAYNVNTDGSAMAMSYSALRNPLIKAIVSQFVEIIETRLTREEVLSMLGDRARKCDDDETFLKLVQQITRIEGWETKPTTPPPNPKSDFEKVLEAERAS